MEPTVDRREPAAPLLAARGIDTYRRTEVQSRTPLELVVMLYDGLLRSMEQARSAVLEGNIPVRRDAVSRALAIVAELRGSLDHGAGGELAGRLDALYGYVSDRLMAAAFAQQPGPIDEALRVVRTLAEAWSAAAAGAAEPARP